MTLTKFVCFLSDPVSHGIVYIYTYTLFKLEKMYKPNTSFVICFSDLFSTWKFQILSFISLSVLLTSDSVLRYDHNQNLVKLSGIKT